MANGELRNPKSAMRNPMSCSGVFEVKGEAFAVEGDNEVEGLRWHHNDTRQTSSGEGSSTMRGSCVTFWIVTGR